MLEVSKNLMSPFDRLRVAEGFKLNVSLSLACPEPVESLP